MVLVTVHITPTDQPDRNKENGLLLVRGSGDMVHHCVMWEKTWWLVALVEREYGRHGCLSSQEADTACEWGRFLL